METTSNSTQEDQKPIISSFSGGPGNKQRRNWLWIGLAALPILVIAIALVVWLRSGSSQLSSEQAVAAATAAQSEPIAIKLTTSGPSPAAVTVKKGQSITWENNDSRQHRLTADQKLLVGFDSADPLVNGDAYTFTFETAGTFHYYDPANPTEFNGTVTVQ